MTLRALVALVLVVLPTFAAAGPGGSPIANPGFEADADGDGRPDGWTFGTTPYADTVACTYSLSSDSFAGNRALAISVPSAGNCGVASSAFGVTAGSPVRATIMRTVVTGWCIPILGLAFYDAAGSVIPPPTVGFGVSPYGNGWDDAQSTEVAPVGATSGRLVVDGSCNGADTILLDEAVVTFLV